jgi:hypothetical protein
MAVVRDLKVKLRINLLTTEMLERGSELPGKDGSTRKLIQDMPEITVDADELERRIADAWKVLHQGWELDNDAPPKGVSTAGVLLLTKNSVTLKGYVDTVSETTCGFIWGATRDVNTFTDTAAQSPVAANIDDVLITTAVTGLTPGTKYYYRAYVNVAGMLTRYGNVRSFTTPLV